MATKKTDSKYKFQNWREAPYKADSVTGSAMAPVYTSYYDENGVLKVEKIAEENLHEKIQMYKDECSIESVIRQYEMGDPYALNKVQGFYIDATTVPENMADLMNKLSKAEKAFNELPAHIKMQYGNDFTRFLCTFEPMDIIGAVTEEKPLENVVEKEVNENES